MSFIISSDEVAELYSALAVAQGGMEAARMDAVNPFYNSRYTTLNSLRAVARPELEKNGLSIVQMPTNDNGQLSVTTRLCHKSGQWMESTLSASVDMKSKNMLQEIGKAITYLRRYTYASVLGLTSDEDEDGNDVTIVQQVKQSNAKTVAKPKPKRGKGDWALVPEFQTKLKVKLEQNSFTFDDMWEALGLEENNWNGLAKRELLSDDVINLIVTHKDIPNNVPAIAEPS